MDKPVGVWFHSSKTNGAGGMCVEAMRTEDGGMRVRDTKLGEGSPVLAFTEGEWKAFLGGVSQGEFDL